MWSCPQCTLDNPIIARNCTACEAPAPFLAAPLPIRSTSENWWIRRTPLQSLRLRLENNQQVRLRPQQEQEISKLLNGQPYDQSWLIAFPDSDVCFQTAEGNNLRLEVWQHVWHL